MTEQEFATMKEQGKVEEFKASESSASQVFQQADQSNIPFSEWEPLLRKLRSLDLDALTALLEGGSSASVKSFSLTKDLADANGATNVIPHGLGRVPTYLRATGFVVAGSGQPLSSFGTFDGAAKCIFYSINGANIQSNSDTGVIVAFVPNGGVNFQAATVAVDDTNITLTWIKVGAPSGSGHIIIEAY
jgi:hypothetical protein